MAVLMPPVKFRAVDSNGAALIGGRLFSFVAATTTPLETYVDSTEGTANSNPVILNSNGEANVWLKVGLFYKFVLEDANEVVQWTVDNVSG